MKEYRLKAWTEPPAPFQSTAHRRMLSDMSQRYLSVAQLAASSGIRRPEVSLFLEALGTRGVLLERELFLSDSVLNSVRPLGDWIRRKLNLTQGSR